LTPRTVINSGEWISSDWPVCAVSGTPMHDASYFTIPERLLIPWLFWQNEAKNCSNSKGPISTWVMNYPIAERSTRGL
jgi:hypothetical protein